MSLSRPLKSLKIRLFSTFQILENCCQIRKKTLTVWKFQTIKVILYSKLHFMFSHDFFISQAESFALKLDKTVCPEIQQVLFIITLHYPLFRTFYYPVIVNYFPHNTTLFSHKKRLRTYYVDSEP